jgi:hypothetical protein
MEKYGIYTSTWAKVGRRQTHRFVIDGWESAHDLLDVKVTAYDGAERLKVVVLYDPDKIDLECIVNASEGVSKNDDSAEVGNHIDVEGVARAVRG